MFRYFILVLQFVTIGILGPNLANAVAPVQIAMESIIGKLGFYFVAIGTLISIGGINLANAFIIPRTVVALVDNHLLPKFMTKRNRNNAPYWAIIATVLVTLPIALSGSFATLASISVVSRFAQYLPTCLAVIGFRRKMPNAKRSFKLPFGITIPLIAVGVSIWLLTQISLKELIYGFCGLLVAVSIYYLMKYQNKKEVH